jgi:hypothetical protein
MTLPVHDAQWRNSAKKLHCMLPLKTGDPSILRTVFPSSAACMGWPVTHDQELEPPTEVGSAVPNGTRTLIVRWLCGG